MYRDPKQWASIRHRILVEGISRGQVSRETGISMLMLRKMLRYPEPQPRQGRGRGHSMLGPFIPTISRMLQRALASPDGPGVSSREVYEHIREQGYRGAQTTIRHYLSALKRRQRQLWEDAYDRIGRLDREAAVSFLIAVAEQARVNPHENKLTSFSFGKRHDDELTHAAAFRWMRQVQQKRMDRSDLQKELGEVPDLSVLLDTLYEGGFHQRNRSLAVLASLRGWDRSAICRLLMIEQKTCRSYVRAYGQGGAAALVAHRPAPNRKTDSEPLKNLIFRVLHEPPSNHGLNRTTWTLDALSRVLAEKGSPACDDTIRTITREAGWRWRKARRVLTSPDRDYSEKLEKVRATLSSLQANEAFFSIDEFGPFAVRKVGGRALMPPGEVCVIPEFQTAKGKLILTAALELASNQVTHFYSEKKNTAEMIRMAESLVAAYPGYRRLYLSWDAASWHVSKGLQDWLCAHNASAPEKGLPLVAIVPLPATAQFLNVIESVFSGMARAVLHNSNYASPEEAKAAIDRYFAERNAQFRGNPKRAGDKIWGKERERALFSEANNCKDPRYSS
jgi:transposase